MAERVELFFIISNSLDDADFDDISLSYVGSSALAGMKLQNGAGMDACYAPGAEVVVTSNDLDYDSAQLGTVSTVHTTGTMEVVNLKRLTNSNKKVMSFQPLPLNHVPYSRNKTMYQTVSRSSIVWCH